MLITHINFLLFEMFSSVGFNYFLEYVVTPLMGSTFILCLIISFFHGLSIFMYIRFLLEPLGMAFVFISFEGFL